MLAFAISVGVRAPLLNRPLSAHHELCTALVLIILHNWHTDGFAAHHGAPAITFSGPADLIPPGYTDAPALHDGVLYYLSHPPLAYDLPYVLFKLTGSEPNALGLQLFNLFFHLLTAIAIYLIVRELLVDGSASLAPLFAAVLYLFMPAPLWFHSNVYMSDMFVQNAWVWHILVVLRMYRTQRFGWRWPLIAGVTLFITTTISWPGVWAGVVLFGVALFRWWRSRDGQELWVMIAAILGVGLALGYTAWRWLQVVDADALWAYYTGRFAERGSTGLQEGPWTYVKQLAVNYRTGFLPVILIGVVLWVARRRSIRSGLRAWPLFLALAVLPVLLDHVLLLQYAGHDFAALKGGVLLCALAGIGLSVLRARWAVSGLLLTCLAGALYFYRTNPLSSKNDGLFRRQMEQGQDIAVAAQSTDMVFTQGFTTEPQVQWYAKRTLFRVDSGEQAIKLLRASGVERGLIVTYGGGLETMELVRAE